MAPERLPRHQRHVGPGRRENSRCDGLITPLGSPDLGGKFPGVTRQPAGALWELLRTIWRLEMADSVVAV